MAKYSVRLGDDTVTIDADDYAIDSLGDGVYVVSDGARRWRVFVAGPPANRWIFVEGRARQLEVIAAGSAARRGRSSAPDMSAPMPATVVKLLVSPGARVAKGDPVVVLEAMKMELPIKAARDGVVRAIRCRAGDLVQPGVNLVELDS